MIFPPRSVYSGPATCRGRAASRAGAGRSAGLRRCRLPADATVSSTVSDGGVYMATAEWISEGCPAGFHSANSALPLGYPAIIAALKRCGIGERGVSIRHLVSLAAGLAAFVGIARKQLAMGTTPIAFAVLLTLASVPGFEANWHHRLGDRLLCPLDVLHGPAVVPYRRVHHRGGGGLRGGDCCSHDWPRAGSRHFLGDCISSICEACCDSPKRNPRGCDIGVVRHGRLQRWTWPLICLNDL